MHSFFIKRNLYQRNRLKFGKKEWGPKEECPRKSGVPKEEVIEKRDVS